MSFCSSWWDVKKNSVKMTIAKTAQAKYIGKTRQMKLRLEAFSRLPLAAPPPLPFTEWNSRSGTLPKLEVGADSFVSPISNISLRYEMFLQYISEDMHGRQATKLKDELVFVSKVTNLPNQTFKTQNTLIIQ